MSDPKPSRFAKRVAERQQELETDLEIVESSCRWRVDEANGTSTGESFHEVQRADMIESGFISHPGPVLAIGPASATTLQVATDGLMEGSEYWYVTMVAN